MASVFSSDSSVLSISVFAPSRLCWLHLPELWVKEDSYLLWFGTQIIYSYLWKYPLGIWVWTVTFDCSWEVRVWSQRKWELRSFAPLTLYGSPLMNIYCQIDSIPFSSFLSGIPIMRMATLAVATLQSMDILFRFFSVFVLFAFWCLGILLIYPELRDYFLSCVWSKINPSKAFFISVSMFFICSISFLFFLKISGYLLTLLLWSCISSLLPIRALSN